MAATDRLAEARRELKGYLLGPDHPDALTRFNDAVEALAARTAHPTETTSAAQPTDTTSTGRPAAATLAVQPTEADAAPGAPAVRAASGA